MEASSDHCGIILRGLRWRMQGVPWSGSAPGVLECLQGIYHESGIFFIFSLHFFSLTLGRSSLSLSLSLPWNCLFPWFRRYFTEQLLFVRTRTTSIVFINLYVYENLKTFSRIISLFVSLSAIPPRGILFTTQLTNILYSVVLATLRAREKKITTRVSYIRALKILLLRKGDFPST